VKARRYFLMSSTTPQTRDIQTKAVTSLREAGTRRGTIRRSGTLPSQRKRRKRARNFSAFRPDFERDLSGVGAGLQMARHLTVGEA